MHTRRWSKARTIVTVGAVKHGYKPVGQKVILAPLQNGLGGAAAFCDAAKAQGWLLTIK
jgi:hypothetical protein